MDEKQLKLAEIRGRLITAQGLFREEVVALYPVGAAVRWSTNGHPTKATTYESVGHVVRHDGARTLPYEPMLIVSNTATNKQQRIKLSRVTG